MFTVELKINGSLIGHVYGHNEGLVEQPHDFSNSNPKSKYKYAYYGVENQKLINGKITHSRDDGLERLISSILLDVDKKKSEN